MGGGVLDFGASESPSFIGIMFCSPTRPSTAHHLVIGMGEGSVGEESHTVGAGPRSLPEPDLFTNPLQFPRLCPTHLNQMLKTPFHFQLGWGLCIFMFVF